MRSNYINPVLKVIPVEISSNTAKLIVFCVRSNSGIVIAYTPNSSNGNMPEGYRIALPRIGNNSPITSIDVCDFDEDGIPEIVAAMKEQNRVLLNQYIFRESYYSDTLSAITDFLGTNTIYPGILANHRWVTELITADIVSPHIVLAEDLNNDSSTDIIVASQEDDALTWFSSSTASESDSNMSWQKHIIQNNTFCPSAVAIADLNGDGNLDIISAGDSIGYWLNTGSMMDTWRRGFIISSFPRHDI